jgi:hypothetical protein
LSSVTSSGGTNPIGFSGSQKKINTGTGAGVNLDNNDGGTITFSGGGLDIATTSGVGFQAINGAAAVNVTGSGNSISSTNAAALNVASTTIGASGLTFQSISAGNNDTGADPANGIVLNNTGSSGGLTITGSGTANSGGVIQHTGSHGVALMSTSNVQFNYFAIHDTGDHGIFGDGVNNLTFRDSTIYNFGNATPSSGASEGAMHFESTNTANTASGHGLTGTVVIQRVTIGPDGHFVLSPNPPSPYASKLSLELFINNNSFSQVGIGGRWLASARTTVNARYKNNTMTSTSNDAIRSIADATDASLTPHATTNATVSGNNFGTSSAFISLHRSATSTITFSNNTNIGPAGNVFVGSDRGSSAFLDLLNNSVSVNADPNGVDALYLQTSSNGGGNSSICANISGNTLTEAGPNTTGSYSLILDTVSNQGTINLEGWTGSPAYDQYLAAHNTLSGPTPGAATDNPANITHTGADCVTSKP